MFATKNAALGAVPVIALAMVLFVIAFAPQAAAQTACADSVQGRIAWDGSKNTSWTAANLEG